MPTIRLQSSDGDLFPVELEVAKCSVTIRTMLEVLGKCSSYKMNNFLYI